MAAVPLEALDDYDHIFWHKFWNKVGGLRPLIVAETLAVMEPRACLSDGKGYWIWHGGKTRDGYGRVVFDVGGEMRAHHVAWIFAHGDPVPVGADVVHASWCDGGKLCMWPGCLLLAPSKREKAADYTARLIAAYNNDIL